MIDRLRGRPGRHVIVDLRFNPGRNGTLTVDFTSTLPEVIPPGGQVTILTSGNTFSAAIMTTARLAFFAGDRAQIMGEPMGDRGRFWGEGGEIVLPNSGLQVGYATAMHDWERGCRLSEMLDCYLLLYVIGVAAGSLEPDRLVEPRFAEYRNGEDSAMLTIAAQAAG